MFSIFSFSNNSSICFFLYFCEKCVKIQFVFGLDKTYFFKFIQFICFFSFAFNKSSSKIKEHFYFLHTNEMVNLQYDLHDRVLLKYILEKMEKKYQHPTLNQAV